MRDVQHLATPPRYGCYKSGVSRTLRGSVNGKVPGEAVGTPRYGMDMFDELARRQAVEWATTRGHRVLFVGECVTVADLF